MSSRALLRWPACALLVLVTLVLGAACTQPGPAAPKDSPDPFALHVGQQYLLYSTSTVVAGQRLNVPVWTSTDQRSWHLVGDALPTAAFPDWASPQATWAPSVQQRADGQWVLYVSLIDQATGQHAVAGALAAVPTGPFSGAGLAPVQPDGDTADLTPGGAIDPSPVAWKGAPYLLWKSDAYPYTAARPSRILGRQLAADGLTWAPGSHTVVLLTARAGWQGYNVEGPSMVASPGGAVLFYSGSFYASLGYATGWAHCPAGPTASCTDMTTAKPLVPTVGSMRGPGGAEVVRGGGPAELVYHGWTDASANYAPYGHATRQLWVSSLAIDSHGVPHLS